MHLRVNTSGGVAEDALVEDGEDAAASALANGRADLREVVGVGGSLRSCGSSKSVTVSKG